MFKGGINTFSLVINYLDEAWTPRHVNVGLFEVHETSGSAMATTLWSIIDCELLKLLQVYEGTCFGLVMSKMCQYETNDNKVLVGLTLVNVKDAQIGL
jgi:hypothetical protein